MRRIVKNGDSHNLWESPFGEYPISDSKIALYLLAAERLDCTIKRPIIAAAPPPKIVHDTALWPITASHVPTPIRTNAAMKPRYCPRFLSSSNALSLSKRCCCCFSAICIIRSAPSGIILSYSANSCEGGRMPDCAAAVTVYCTTLLPSSSECSAEVEDTAAIFLNDSGLSVFISIPQIIAHGNPIAVNGPYIIFGSIVIKGQWRKPEDTGYSG